jgi:hypothetical protein
MSNDPVEIAGRIRAQRQVIGRILRVSVPVTLVGFVIVFAADSHMDEPWMNVVIVPTFLAFFATWFSILGLWVLGIRDFRNMLRPGSADADDEHR